jgi:hypothetical protein
VAFHPQPLPDNKATHSVYLGTEFRNIYQGDLPVIAYCTKVKLLCP